MKNFIRYTLLMAAAVVGTLMVACSGDDGDDPAVVSGPAFAAIEITPDNRIVFVDFSEPVSKGGVYMQPLTAECFSVSLESDKVTLDSIKVIHSTGNASAMILLYLKGRSSGEEVLTIRPANPEAIINARSVAMNTSASISGNLSDPGIIGRWVSAGDNLSELFRQFGFDTVSMLFRYDGTYVYTSVTTGGIRNVLTGTFVQQKNSGTAIRSVRMNQLNPVAATIEGIFLPENGDPVTMKYETAQTEPAVAGLTPPTPEAGFGSTGLTGSDNTQTYILVSSFPPDSI